MFAASAGRASYRDVDANADAMKGGMRRCAALKIVVLLASGWPLLSVAASPRYASRGSPDCTRSHPRGESARHATDGHGVANERAIIPRKRSPSGMHGYLAINR